MKLLSVRQPWAHLIVTGVKDVENRTWVTGYRGPLAIHASLVVDPNAARLVPGLDASLLPRGAIVGVVNLDRCEHGNASAWADPNRYHWVLTEPRCLPEPIPWKGQVKIVNIPDEIAARIDSQATTFDWKSQARTGGTYSKER